MIHSIAMVYVYIVCLLFDIDYVFFSIPISLICEKYNGGIILYEVISDLFLEYCNVFIFSVAIR